jgi:predicted phosphodiesterase
LFHAELMVATVAVMSDVHGVLPVLEAVLAQPDVRSADRIVVTGDLASGPQPVEALQALTALGERGVLVRGNADRELVALARGERIEVPDEISPWAADQLGPGQVELLAGLPHPVVLDIDGFGPTVFCHGTPRHDDEVVLVDTRLGDGPRCSRICLPTSEPWCAATPICRSCGSWTAAWW